MNVALLRSRFVATVLVVACAAASASAAPAPSAVQIEKTPARIERRSFDPKNPPPEMPVLKGSEAALCEFKFGCDTRLGFELPRFSLKTSTATVTACEISIHLNITVWTPAGASPALVAHEETHREICEVYYEHVESVARQLADAVIGRKLTVPSANRESDTDQAVRDVQKELIKNFLAQTAERCTDAQERFDLITDHSRNPIANEDAKASAIAEEFARARSSFPR